MSENVTVTNLSPVAYKAKLNSRTRREAVECALELIHAQIAGRQVYELKEQLDALSGYADKIEAALNKENK